MNIWNLICLKVRDAFNLHKDDPNAHHTRYTDDEVDDRIDIHASHPSAHHTRYTDDEVDDRISIHASNASAHHTKYTNADAVAAIANADQYLKNTGDVSDGNQTVNGRMIVNQTEDWFGAQIYGYDDESNICLELCLDPYGNAYIQVNKVGYWGQAGDLILNALLRADKGVNLFGNPIYNPTSYDDASLSGTPKLIEVSLGGDTYYFKVYPTKT